jgi:hypothetical protein
LKGSPWRGSVAVLFSATKEVVMLVTLSCFLAAIVTLAFAIAEHRDFLRVVLVNPVCPVKMDVKKQAPKILCWISGSIFLATGITQLLEIKTIPMILLVTVACLIASLAIVNVSARIGLVIVRDLEE